MFKVSTEKISNWILVTGAIRSGTTFLGTVLSMPRSVDYIHEPLNPQCGISEIREPHRYIRSDLTSAESHPYHRYIESIFDYNFKLKGYYPAADPIPSKLLKRLVGSRGPYHLRLAKLNPSHSAAIIKDPHSVLLCEYFYSIFRVKPVIIVKHPVSFIASLKRVGWWPSPLEIADQPDLISDYFLEEKHFLKQKWATPLEQSAAFWRAIHKVILSQSSKYADWLIVKHEDLSKDPVFTFRSLYSQLDLPWNSRIEAAIISQTMKSKSPRAKRGKIQDFKRNSAAIFEANRSTITVEERQKIFDIVKDVALQLYTKETFLLE